MVWSHSGRSPFTDKQQHPLAGSGVAQGEVAQIAFLTDRVEKRNVVLHGQLAHTIANRIAGFGLQVAFFYVQYFVPAARHVKS
jgi:hypothetical protein